MHTLEPAADHELAGQEVHALELAAGLYVLFVHVVQAVAAPYAKVPAGQVWQAADTPSTKYCPPLQQTPVPLERQRIVPDEQPDTVQFCGSMGRVVRFWPWRLYMARTSALLRERLKIMNSSTYPFRKLVSAPPMALVFPKKLVVYKTRFLFCRLPLVGTAFTADG